MCDVKLDCNYQYSLMEEEYNACSCFLHALHVYLIIVQIGFLIGVKNCACLRYMETLREYEIVHDFV